MRVIVFGATGMVGQGAVREALAAPDVEQVLTVGRRKTGQQHAKLRELEVPDLHDYSEVEGELGGYDACFFCLGVTSSGLDEAAYARITLDITVAAGSTLARLNPGMTFIFVSGAGTDGTEKGRVMWARVKGKAENAILGMSFNAAYAFRPAFIQPLDGIESRTPSYRVLYKVIRPVVPLLRLLAKDSFLDTRQLGQAMLTAVRKGAPKKVLEARDIRALAAQGAA